MKNAVLISASPKVNEESVSGVLISMADAGIDSSRVNKTIIDVRETMKAHRTEQAFKAMSEADALIFAFPLYIFCMPGILMRFLEDYYNYYLQNGKPESEAKVYALVNCGFPEAEINSEAIRVVKSFSRHIGAKFRFGVLIGGGGMILGARNAPFMKKFMARLNEAFSLMEKDILSDDAQELGDISIAVKFPRWLYMLGGNSGWGVFAKKNGLAKKDLYRKPYAT